MKTQVICLAAGEGKRMKSQLPKVLHGLCGLPMVEWALRAANAVDAHPILVVGHGREQVMEAVGERAQFAVQAQQLGTGHAVMTAQGLLEPDTDCVLVTAGDMPLLRPETVLALQEKMSDGADAAVLTARVADPFGYGRILRDAQGSVCGIVEERDATAQQKQICEINTSIYIFRASRLKEALLNLTCQNDQHEYYLTDAVGDLAARGCRVESLEAAPGEAMGVNDRVQLAQAGEMLRRRINEAHMRAGVTLVDPQQTYIDADVTIGRDTVIWPGNYLTGNTSIGENCVLYPGSRIADSRIGSGVTVQSSVLTQASVDDGSTVGPFAYMRPKSAAGKNVKIGDFVEIKNATVGDGTKISHLTYVGDADVGQHVNLGCGVVFVNYNGKEKFRTQVEDDAFIGCNTNLVAPVHIGRGAYTAAGSTITQDVPDDTLGIARARQVNKASWISPKKKG
ncbi:MAG: bifunctional UDP-N-acetylglucosamine diphosphorylase/glucosamine-1-phosphate N-acetyltransferase GlmU [Eubacteriales bacterium]|nr:bifunctional UDP-N-acetylglucosamine diphosphorylase/glucosamine-1-phosphate N-acetyltransferase GlmU [Eubacteriales bacterium]